MENHLTVPILCCVLGMPPAGLCEETEPQIKFAVLEKQLSPLGIFQFFRHQEMGRVHLKEPCVGCCNTMVRLSLWIIILGIKHSQLLFLPKYIQSSEESDMQFSISALSIVHILNEKVHSKLEKARMQISWILSHVFKEPKYKMG